MINTMKTRGERLKARRLELKLTLKQVAEAVGISLPGVQNLERGDVMPSLEIGLSLAKCLRKPVQWILYGTESDPDRVPVIGTTESGPDSDWQPGEPANTERFLPFVSQRNTVYALTVGNQVQRNYQPGDVILVDSSLTLVPGEDVLVCEKNGEITIQRLARFDEEHYYLDSANSQRVIHDKSDLQFVHQVVGTIKSFMVEGR
ncbi:helix-turn-helix domain-containing protein [Klebsiella pneumoniae]|uniref:Gp38 n=2 Tax=Enterobacteriaceae TaxID=543 RepID=A0ABN8TGL4_9ENTR|nr:LexA family transcriptional regulator [Pseudocitrobacter vendiensis]ECY2423267.1 helix-turn-helix domain-containing protein [Salmonella enterica]SAB23712.1 Phage repressor protein C2 [Enterobacter hormaechei]EEH8549877.1 helix-turn-helix domain-containing protein [Salmonella enterica]CAH6661992.1 Gp38 [Pseudocitrobacter vendiensis]SAI43654.1 Phage repressor protein C2 [Enterobacter hormaechei]